MNWYKPEVKTLLVSDLVKNVVAFAATATCGNIANTECGTTASSKIEFPGTDPGSSGCGSISVGPKDCLIFQACTSSLNCQSIPVFSPGRDQN